MKNIYKELSAVFEQKAPNGKMLPMHKWKVQTTKGKNAMCVAYVDARQVTQRLNEVLGVDNWSDTLVEMNTEGIICEISANIGEKVVTHSNVGVGGSIHKEKTEASDAFKRAATKFGVGAYLYELEAVSLPIAVVGGKKVASTSEGVPLVTGADLTSYINTMHPLRLKLAEIWNAIPKTKQSEYSEDFAKIWEELS